MSRVTSASFSHALVHEFHLPHAHRYQIKVRNTLLYRISKTAATHFKSKFSEIELRVHTRFDSWTWCDIFRYFRTYQITHLSESSPTLANAHGHFNAHIYTIIEDTQQFTRGFEQGSIDFPFLSVIQQIEDWRMENKCQRCCRHTTEGVLIEYESYCRLILQNPSNVSLTVE